MSGADAAEPVRRVEIGEQELEIKKSQEHLPFRCQRCREGVYVPERELRVCPNCARAVCRKCQAFDPQVEAFVCRDCVRVKRVRRRAGRQALHYWLKIVAFGAVIGSGASLAMHGIWLPGAILGAVGVVGAAWCLAIFHRCPLCYGNAVAARRGGRLEYRCTLCGHWWHE